MRGFQLRKNQIYFIEKNFLENTFQFSQKTVDEFKEKDFVNFQEYFLEKINSDKTELKETITTRFEDIKDEENF